MGVWAVVANLSVWIMFVALQNLENKFGSLPKRSKKFLYLQDQRAGGWGDVICLSLIDFAVASTAANISGEVIAFCLLAAVDITLLFHQFFWISPLHIPDSGYPAVGKISVFGIAHLLYFASQIAISLFCLWRIATGQIIVEYAVIGLVGGIGYLAMFGWDILDIKNAKKLSR